MIWTHAHHLAGYEQQVHQIVVTLVIIKTLWFHMFRFGSWWGVSRQYQDLWHEVCIRMLMSSSLPPWISCTDISYTRQVKTAVKPSKTGILLQALSRRPAPALLTQYSLGNFNQTLSVRFCRKYTIHVANCYKQYYIVNLLSCRCARVYQLQLIPSGTSLWIYLQLLTVPPFPWISAWTGSPRRNTLAPCPKSGEWMFQLIKFRSQNFEKSRYHAIKSFQVQQVQLPPGEHKAADNAETPCCCFLPLEKVAL